MPKEENPVAVKNYLVELHKKWEIQAASQKTLQNYKNYLKAYLSEELISEIKPAPSKEFAKKMRDFFWSMFSKIVVFRGDPGCFGISVEKYNGQLHKVEHDRGMVEAIFSEVLFYFDRGGTPPRWYSKPSLMGRRLELLKAYDFFVKTGRDVAQDHKHKSQKRQFGIPNEQTLRDVRITLSTWTGKLIESIDKDGLEERPVWRRHEKISGKWFILGLYVAFTLWCQGLPKRDTCYNIAKITLIIGVGKHGRALQGQRTTLPKELIRTEAERILKMLQRSNFRLVAKSAAKK